MKRTVAQHTAEPWSIETDVIEECDIWIAVNGTEETGSPVLLASVDFDEDDGPIKRPEARANANRIVECVNACRGINPAAVPAMLRALKLFADFDAENCQTGQIDYESVKFAVLSAIRRAELTNPNARAIELYASGLTTLDVPHRKLPGLVTYYVGQYPEGDATIHKKYPHDHNGYGGGEVAFLLDDGTVEIVRGPYCCDGVYDHGDRAEVLKRTGDKSLIRQASRITVGRNLSPYSASGPADVVFEEKEWQVTPWQDRIKTRWHGLEVKIALRGGAIYKQIPQGGFAKTAEES